MNELLLLVGLSEIFSCVLLFALFKKKMNIGFKIVISVLTLIPIFGPIFYLFITDETAPQNPMKKNSSYFGKYSTDWKTIKPYIQSAIEKEKAKLDNQKSIRAGKHPCHKK